MSRINLFFLEPDGWMAGGKQFTYQLAMGFRLAGREPKIYRIGKRPGYKAFAHGVTAEIVTLEQAVKLQGPKIITAYDWKEQSENIVALCNLGAVPVVNAVNELGDEFVAYANTLPQAVVTIRKTLNEIAHAKGLHNAVYIPHPYTPRRVMPPEFKASRNQHAISLCRIVSVKNIEMLVEANELLRNVDVGKAIRMTGQVHRPYIFFTLGKKAPTWKDWHDGEPEHYKPGSAVTKALQARYVVDLTVFKRDSEGMQDKGGTQYVFFEAWNAGSILIVHRDWLTPGGELVENVNCLAISTAQELAELLLKDTPEHRRTALQSGGIKVLLEHQASKIIPQYEALI